MKTRTLGVSEARRLLPELVKEIASEGGDVEITVRGRPQVRLSRVSDSRRAGSRQKPYGLDPALRIVLNIPPEDLILAIRELRSSQGGPRRSLLDETAPVRRTKKSPKKRRHR